MRKTSRLIVCTILPAVFAYVSDSSRAFSQSDTAVTVNAESHVAMVKKGLDFLRKSQLADGSFSTTRGPGVTGLLLSSMIASGLQPGDPMVDKSLAYILKSVRDNGGVYAEGSVHANYETCLAITALSKLNSAGKYTDIIKNAEKFVKEQQWDEGEGIDPAKPEYGGAGYGSKSRPDLSNTSFLIEALKDAGCSDDDPAIQRALAFVSRCQNLESPHNTTPFANRSNDGGFYYTPANGGESMAGTDEATGALRSYASMSYAGLKSMIYAGVDKSDVRVKAVTDFLRKNYSVSSNPGMGDTGLYYYHHTMAKALSAVGEAEFETVNGKRNWKKDLSQQLKASQQDDGSWLNSNPRWMEGDPNLVTGYVLLALSYVK
ncbi:MAG: prenyltransferase/squalene oxidase repeat-containing protein [Pirellula sp.]|jgi:squalene-hopene/tetraprenyl-beta-curcumene cyclase